jgi:hypothetical protein
MEVLCTHTKIRFDRNYNKGKKYTNKKILELNDWWLKLNDQYFKLIKDGRGKSKLRSESKKIALIYEINIIETIINKLSFFTLQKNLLPLSAYNGFITQLSSSVKKISSGLPKRDKEDVYDWIKRLRLYKESLETKQKLLDKTDVKEYEFSDFYKELAYMEMALEKDSISEHINMTKWIIYKNQIHDKINKNGKQ